jgi:hypothetical protein
MEKNYWKNWEFSLVLSWNTGVQMKYVTVAYQSQCPLRCKPLHRSLLLSDLAEQTGHRVLANPRISHAGSFRCMPFWVNSLELKGKKIFQIHIESDKNTTVSCTKVHTHTLKHTHNNNNNNTAISLGKNLIRILSKVSTNHAEGFRICFISYRTERSVVVSTTYSPQSNVS